MRALCCSAHLFSCLCSLWLNATGTTSIYKAVPRGTPTVTLSVLLFGLVSSGPPLFAFHATTTTLTISLIIITISTSDLGCRFLVSTRTLTVRAQNLVNQSHLPKSKCVSCRFEFNWQLTIFAKCCPAPPFLFILLHLQLALGGCSPFRGNRLLCTFVSCLCV